MGSCRQVDFHLFYFPSFPIYSQVLLLLYGSQVAFIIVLKNNKVMILFKKITPTVIISKSNLIPT